MFIKDVWELFAAALVDAGASPADLADHVCRARTQTTLDGSALLFDALVEYAPLHLDRLLAVRLIEDCATWMVRGPCPGPSRKLWEFLTHEGCPREQLYIVLDHCVRDPNCGPQDFEIVSDEAAVQNVRRYAQLGFPREHGPWVGLGCEIAFERIRGAGSYTVMPWQFFRVLRRIIEPALAELLDERARIEPVLRFPPSVAEEFFSPAGSDSMPSATLALVQALDAALASGEAVHDPGADRFALAGTPLTPMRPRLRRPVPPPPDPADARSLVAAICAWLRSNPVAAEITNHDPAVKLRAKVFSDPLVFVATTLQDALEGAALCEIDEIGEPKSHP